MSNEDKVEKSDAEWREQLSEEEFRQFTKENRHKGPRGPHFRGRRAPHGPRGEDWDGQV